MDTMSAVVVLTVCAFIGSPLPAQTGHSAAVVHGSRSERKIALTFDACSTRQPGRFDEGVARILAERHIPATIFLGGKWMLDRPKETKYLASLPNIVLGNHAFFHPHMTRLSDSRIREELHRTQDVMDSLTGRRARLFRPPYGEYDDRITRVAASTGLRTVKYDLPAGDPDTHATKKRLVDYVVRKARNGSIIVMHINGRGWHTAEALPEILDRLREKGLVFVTVEELLRGLPAESDREIQKKACHDSTEILK